MKNVYCVFVKELGGGNPTEVEVQLLDMQPCEGGVTLFLRAVNHQISPQYYYAFGMSLDFFTLQLFRNSEW